MTILDTTAKIHTVLEQTRAIIDFTMRGDGSREFIGISLLDRYVEYAERDNVDHDRTQLVVQVVWLDSSGSRSWPGFRLAYVGAFWLDNDRELFDVKAALENLVAERAEHRDYLTIGGAQIPEFVLYNSALLPLEWKTALKQYSERGDAQMTSDEFYDRDVMIEAVVLHLRHQRWTDHIAQIRANDGVVTWIGQR